MTALLLQGSRDYFDLDDIMYLGIDAISKESVQVAREAMDKLTGDRLGLLANNTSIYYTMTAIDPDFVMV